MAIIIINFINCIMHKSIRLTCTCASSKNDWNVCNLVKHYESEIFYKSTLTS